MPNQSNCTNTGGSTFIAESNWQTQWKEQYKNHYITSTDKVLTVAGTKWKKKAIHSLSIFLDTKWTGNWPNVTCNSIQYYIQIGIQYWAYDISVYKSGYHKKVRSEALFNI